jgi:hypothetical protein
MRWILSSIIALCASMSSAADIKALVELQQRNVQIEAISTMGLKWKVGDRTEHGIKLASFINGSMKTDVRREEDAGFWTFTDFDMGFAGKNKIETLYDRNSGKVLRMIVDGKEQDPGQGGDPNDFELISTEEATITVKAGTFNTVHLKIRKKSTNEITEAWINMRDVPISGQVKMTAPTQIGQMVSELVSFAK